MQKIICPRPLRKRHDDKVVEVFLNAYQQGRFAKNPNWLPQYKVNVEVIATSADGTTLAVEHTRVFAFEGHQEQEKALRPIAECLEAVRLPGVSDRWFQIRFRPHFIGKHLQRHRSHVERELVKWAELTLPTIAPSEYVAHPFVIPIPLPDGKCPTVKLDVEVWGEIKVERPICVSGCLPEGRRLESGVRRALQNKLQKLVSADAKWKLLMIEIPTHTDSDVNVVNVIRDVAHEFPLLSKMDKVVFGKTFVFNSDGSSIFFRLWNPRTQTWSDHLHALIDPR